MLGAIIGDVVGSVYEFNNVRVKNFDILTSKSTYTDDTVLTIAVADALMNAPSLDEKTVSIYLQTWARKFPHAGYGGGFAHWIYDDDPHPYQSYGNGAAMRISAVGWLANSEEEVKELSKAVTQVTHNHPEGLKGAEVTAMCIYYARIGKSKEDIYEYVSKNYDISFNYEDLKKTNKFNEICQESVPQAIFCFLISKDYEDCIRTTVSIGGDSDTLCAISGAIAEAYYKKLPTDLVKGVYERLPLDMKLILEEFDRVVNIKLHVTKQKEI